MFQEYFLDDPGFRLVYSEIYQNFPKPVSKKSIFKAINRILAKYLQENLHFRRLFCIYKQNL